MALITHVFPGHQRYQNGRLVSDDKVPRRINFNYDATGNVVDIEIIPTMTPKRAFLTKQDGFTLYYKGADADYRFVLECWPDNGTIKRFSVFRNDTGVEYRYLSDLQDRLW